MIPKSMRNDAKIDEKSMEIEAAAWGRSRRRVWKALGATFPLFGRNRDARGSILSPLKIENGTKTGPMKLDQHFGPPKISSGRGSGKDMNNS